MFGALILQLPTEEGYTGGKFVVKRNKNVQEFYCHMVSGVAFCYTLFFADCLQELRMIKSVTRLCLAFNLVKRFLLEPIHSGSMSDKLESLESVLEPWLKEATAQRPASPGSKLVIPLQHKYTQQNLSFAGLKGDDIIMKGFLKDCRDKNKNHSLDLHLSIVTKHVAQNTTSSGSCCSDGPEEDFMFGKWIGLDDQPIAFKDLRLDMEKEVVGEEGDLFDSEPDEEDFEPVGKGGGTVDSLYHTAVLVAWPYAHSALLASGGSVSRALDILQNKLKTSAPKCCEQLYQIGLYCQQNPSEVWGDDRDSIEDSVTSRLLSLCSRVSMSEDVLQILQLLSKVVHHHGGKKTDNGHKVGVRNADVAVAITSAVQVFGWELVLSPIINLAKECGSTQGESFAHLVKAIDMSGKYGCWSPSG